MAKFLTQQEFLDKAILKHGNVYIYSSVIYVSAHTKIDILCTICNNNFFQTPNSHLNGNGCPICGALRSIQNRTWTIEEFIERANIKHKNRYDYSKFIYTGKDNNGIIICKMHGEFEQTPHNHLQGKGCRKCKQSKGEGMVRSWLEDNNIEFESQKRFDQCRLQRILPFDFYLPEYNMCIEYDGQQHFIPFSFSSNRDKDFMMKNLEQMQKKDIIKDLYCEVNNINLLRIPYYEIDNIDTILSTTLVPKQT